MSHEGTMMVIVLKNFFDWTSHSQTTSINGHLVMVQATYKDYKFLTSHKWASLWTLPVVPRVFAL